MTIRVRLVIWTICLVASCSNDQLTSAKAEKLLNESGRFPQVEDVELEYGIVGYTYDSLPASYYNIQEAGAIKVESLGKSGLFTTTYVFKVDLTDIGRACLVEEDKNPTRQGDRGYLYRSRFRTCTVNLEKVTSVQEIPAVNEAKVNFIVKRENFTPFWYKHYSEIENRFGKDTTEQKKSALFKTDKGWSAKK